MHLFSSIWEYGQYFSIENIDNGHDTLDYGVEVKFDQSNRASNHALQGENPLAKVKAKAHKKRA